MIGHDWGVILSVFGSLFAFGFVYNLVVAWLERHGYDEGYTAILVVFGVLVTLAGVAAFDTQAALIALAAFAASGFWIVVGSISRYAQARRSDQRNLADDKEAGVAK
jgi:hypothetical protein